MPQWEQIVAPTKEVGEGTGEDVGEAIGAGDVVEDLGEK